MPRPRVALESESRSWEREDRECGGELGCCCQQTCSGSEERWGRAAGLLHLNSCVRENKPAGGHLAPVRCAEYAHAQAPTLWGTVPSAAALGSHFWVHAWVVVGGCGQSWRDSRLCCTGGISPLQNVPRKTTLSLAPGPRARLPRTHQRREQACSCSRGETTPVSTRG